LSDERFIRNRDFIEAVRPMHDPCSLRPKQHQRARQRLDESPARDADDLAWRASRICQWPKQIECRLYTKFTTNAGYPRSRAVKERSKHETDADLAQAFFRDFR